MTNDEQAKKKILEAVASLARYEIDAWEKVGPTVQINLIETIETLAPEERVRDRELIVAVCQAVLSSEIEGTTWNANSVTLRTGAIPVSPEIIDLRTKALSILFGLFSAAQNDEERRELLVAMRRATYPGGRTETTDELLQLTLKNGTQIVEFLLSEGETLSYELMETIEHNFWLDYRRARDITFAKSRAKCHDAAKRFMVAVEKLRDKFNKDTTFKKFKVLVGFESVFPFQWEEKNKREASDYHTREQYRTIEANNYVNTIEYENEGEWFALIERIASVESNDMATFPPFAQFLTQLAHSKPQIASRLLEHASERVARFLPAILAGLHESGSSQIYQEEVERVLRDGKYLGALARHLRVMKLPAAELIKRTLQRALEVGQDVAVAECLIMAMALPPEILPPKKELFEPAIKYLNDKQQYWWVHAAWMADEATSFFASLSNDQASLFIPTMVHAPKIEYQIEQILIQLSKHYPELVWDCFAGRLAMEGGSSDRYEAIPYQFHGLENEISKNAKLAVEFGRRIFSNDTRLFRFRGGRLLSAAFPSFPPNFAEELARLADEGTKADIEFILAVMENYHGEEETHEVLKRIVAKFPKDESVRTSVIISLDSTGIVMGEFGFAHAMRDKLEIARKWLDDRRPEVRHFAEDHIRSLQLRIADEQKRAEERKALRELEYDRGDQPENES